MKNLLILLFILPILGAGCVKEEVKLGAEPRDVKIDSIPATVKIGGEDKEILYTDDNTGEDFIIKSDKKDYYSLGGSVLMDFSVTNVSEVAQTASIVYSLGENVSVRYTKRFSHNEVVETEKIIPATTSTPERIEPEKSEAVWDTIVMGEPNIKSEIERKTIGDRISKNGFTDYFNAGETKFYRASLLIPADVNNDEFFIEVFGDKGSYGNLDPTAWTFEELFNPLTVGDIEAQGNWSGHVNFDVTTNAAALFEGTKGLEVVGAVDDNAQNTTGVSSDNGDIYVSIKSDATTGNDAYIQMFSDASQKISLVIRPGVGVGFYAPSWTSLETYAANTWYTYNLQWDDVAQDNKFRARVKKSGSEWTAWSSWVPTDSAYTYINNIRLYLGTSAGITTYYDTISLTDYTPAPPSISVAPNVQLQIFE